MMLKNKRGASLVTVLIFSIVGIGVVMAVMPRLLNLAGSYKQTALRANYIRFVGNLRTALRDPFTCRIALQGQPLGGPALGDVNTSLIIGSTLPSFFEGGVIQAGWRSQFGELEILQARLVTTQPATILPRIVNLDKPSPALTSYQVRINFDVRDPSGRSVKLNTLDPNFRFPEFHIELTANIDPLTGQIYSCHGRDSIAEVCEMAGGAFDASPDMNAHPRLRCHPSTRCWVDEVGVRRTPATPLPMAANPPTCTWPYMTVNWIGRIAGEDLWTCLWCNNKTWTPGVN